MKILFTSVGRRIELIQAFRKAADEMKTELKIIGTDIVEDAPALRFCDNAQIVCRIKDANYIPQLLSICEREKIDCLIPTIDTDLLLLAQNKALFEKIGTKVLISDVDKVALCRDKNYTADYFISLGLKSPMAVNSVEKYEEALNNKTATFPAFIKPKDGSSSINAYKVETIEDLKVYAEKIEDYVIQPFISGREYTIDIFCDYEGNPVYITPRERLAVRAGEVLKTRITHDDSMISEMLTLIADYKPCGQITVQLIKDEKTGENYYIEINPRFGGGAPLSIKAGADSAKAVIRMLNGEKQTYKEKAAREGAVYSRFDQNVCMNEGTEPQVLKGVIFDLDDTLYNEKQYVKSGFKAVGKYLGISDADEQLWKCFEQNLPAIDTFLDNIGLSDKKEESLKIYREHKPEITLNEGVADLIIELRNKGVKVGIITDGRPDGQRNKITALGLEQMVDDIIITDELGGSQFRKPCDIAFRIMQRRWELPFEQIMYVGDNINKDFQAPKQLGMQWMLVKNEKGLYTNSETGLSLPEMVQIIKNKSQ